MGAVFVFSLFAAVCVAALSRPAWGVIGFYGFLLLDPAWNWRWALPAGFAYQEYIFYALFAGFALSGFRLGKQSPAARLGVLSLVGFLGWSYLSGLQTISPQDTAFFLSLFWKIALTAGLAVLLLDNSKLLRVFLVVAVLSQGYNAYQINLDYFQTGFARYAYSRWGSYGVDNNGYSLITVPIMAASLSLALTTQVFKWRVLFLGIAVLQVHQIMLMASRGAMLGGLASALLAVLFMPRTRANVATFAAAATMGVLLAGPFVVDEFATVFANAEDRDSSAESRFYLWKAGVRITMDYPLMGVGPNAARRLVPLPQYYDGGLDQDNKALHNLFLDVSTGMGLPGLLLFSLFLFLPLYCCYSRRKHCGDELAAPCLAVITGIPGYALASMFNSGVLFESGYVLPIAGYVFLNLADQADQENRDDYSPTDWGENDQPLSPEP